MTTILAPRVGVVANDAIIVAMPPFLNVSVNENVSSVSALTVRPVATSMTSGRSAAIRPANRRDVTEPIAKSVDVVRAEGAKQAATLCLIGHPCQCTGLGRHIAIKEKFNRAELKFADVVLGKKLLDVGTLRRVSKFVGDHCRAPGLLGGVAHLLRLLDVKRERLFAQDVLSGLERSHRQRMVGTRWRDDRDSVEIVAANEFHGVGVHPCDTRFGCGFLRLVAAAAADRGDVPALGAKTGYMHLHAEADTDDADGTFC